MMMKRLIRLRVCCFAFGVFAATARAEVALPSNYTQLDTLSAPRGSYVDTGVHAKNDTRTVATFDVHGVREYWFGALDVAWNDKAYAVGNDVSGVFVGYGNSGGTDKKVIANGVHTIGLQDGSYYLDGVLQRTVTTTQIFDLDSTLYLFAQNRKGTAYPGTGQGMLYFMGGQIYDGETLVRDFVPCRTDKGEVGLWDRVDGKFYGNGGTGRFVGMVALPSNYTQLDTLSAPRGSYVDTGVHAKNDTRTVATFDVHGVREYWFGALDVAWNDKAYAVGNDVSGVFVGYGNSGGTDKKVIANGVHTIGLQDGSYYLDGVLQRTVTTTQIFDLDSTLYLFAQNRKGTAYPGTGQGMLYFMGGQIYDGETLVRDFVPCRTDKGEVGLWDRVDGKFYRA